MTTTTSTITSKTKRPVRHQVLFTVTATLGVSVVCEGDVTEERILNCLNSSLDGINEGDENKIADALNEAGIKNDIDNTISFLQYEELNVDIEDSDEVEEDYIGLEC